MAEGEQQQQQQARPIGARALEAAIVLGDRDAVEKILDSGSWFGGLVLLVVVSGSGRWWVEDCF